MALIALCILAAGGLAIRHLARPVRIETEPPVDRVKVGLAEEKINPNDASAASLRRLPDVGPVKAAAIIEYRSGATQPAFRVAEDLDKAPGIGLGIVERAAPYLSLPRRGQHGPEGD